MLTKKQAIINRKIVMLQKGLNNTSLAAKIGCTRIGVYQAISGRFKSVKHSSLMLTSIANALGVTKEEFWPEFYGETENGKSENVQQNAPQCF